MPPLASVTPRVCRPSKLVGGVTLENSHNLLCCCAELERTFNSLRESLQIVCQFRRANQAAAFNLDSFLCCCSQQQQHKSRLPRDERERATFSQGPLCSGGQLETSRSVRFCCWPAQQLPAPVCWPRDNAASCGATARFAAGKRKISRREVE